MSLPKRRVRIGSATWRREQQAVKSNPIRWPSFPRLQRLRNRLSRSGRAAQAGMVHIEMARLWPQRCARVVTGIPSPA